MKGDWSLYNHHTFNFHRPLGGSDITGQNLLIIIGAILVLLVVLWLISERWHPMRSSTLRWFREGGLGDFLSLKTLRGYLYLRLQDQYVSLIVKILAPITPHFIKQWWSGLHHSKILTQDQAETIIRVEENIPLQNLEQVVPYRGARDFILKAPPDILVWECSCRHARQDPCQPTQVCMVIGQPFVDFILEHHPETSRKLNQADALELLRAEHERGHLHTMWFKDSMLGRNYTICNCCKCCCGGIEMMSRYGISTMASSGFVSVPDMDLCTSCGTCVEACPFDALELSEESVSTSWEKCLGCGVCEELCPEGAIRLIRDERKGVPLDVRVLEQETSI